MILNPPLKQSVDSYLSVYRFVRRQCTLPYICSHMTLWCFCTRRKHCRGVFYVNTHPHLRLNKEQLVSPGIYWTLTDIPFCFQESSNFFYFFSTVVLTGKFFFFSIFLVVGFLPLKMTTYRLFLECLVLWNIPDIYQLICMSADTVVNSSTRALTYIINYCAINQPYKKQLRHQDTYNCQIPVHCPTVRDSRLLDMKWS